MRTDLGAAARGLLLSAGLAVVVVVVVGAGLLARHAAQPPLLPADRAAGLRGLLSGWWGGGGSNNSSNSSRTPALADILNEEELILDTKSSDENTVLAATQFAGSETRRYNSTEETVEQESEGAELEAGVEVVSGKVSGGVEEVRSSPAFPHVLVLFDLLQNLSREVGMDCLGAKLYTVLQVGRLVGGVGGEAAELAERVKEEVDRLGNRLHSWATANITLAVPDIHNTTITTD